MKILIGNLEKKLSENNVRQIYYCISTVICEGGEKPHWHVRNVHGDMFNKIVKLKFPLSKPKMTSNHQLREKSASLLSSDHHRPKTTRT